MVLSRSSVFVVGSVLASVVCLSGCGLIDKLKGKKDAGDTADLDATADAAVAVETPDAAPADPDAGAVATVPSPPIVGACKAGDLADCTTKCQVQKNQSSCVNLGIMFLTGNGVAKDTGKAATLFQGACNGGVGAGCDRFGLSLHDGQGIQTDLGRAATTFQKGCDLRNADACNQIALMNVRGDGIPKDTVKAVALFSKACDLGDAFGCGNLANHLASGDGIPRDAARAATLRKASCDKGDQQACRALAASGGADAGTATTTTTPTAAGADAGAPTAADCAQRKKVFMDTCQTSCAEKLAAKNFKKTDAERRLFCEGGCTSQMFNSPVMAVCKGR